MGARPATAETSYLRGRIVLLEAVSAELTRASNAREWPALISVWRRWADERCETQPLRRWFLRAEVAFVVWLGGGFLVSGTELDLLYTMIPFAVIFVGVWIVIGASIIGGGAVLVEGAREWFVESREPEEGKRAGRTDGSVPVGDGATPSSRESGSAGLFDFTSESYRRARLVLASHGRVLVDEPIGPVICARELLLATHTGPAETRELLDTAARLLQPACNQPDPHSYGTPYEDPDFACQLSLADASLWLGIVQWLRADDFASPLRNAAKQYLAASTVPSLPGTITAVPAARSVGGHGLIETKAARALSELVAGTVRLGRPDLASKVDADVAQATRILERHGQHERADILRRLVHAGESAFVSDACGFLRNMKPDAVPILATRDASDTRKRYLQSTRR